MRSADRGRDRMAIVVTELLRYALGDDPELRSAARALMGVLPPSEIEAADQRLIAIAIGVNR